MKKAIQPLLLGFVLAVLVMPPFEPLPATAAQQTAATPAINLNGPWELTEHGLRENQGEKPIVLLITTGTTIAAEFYPASACDDGTSRDLAFVGELRFDPGADSWLLSSTSMWVCSGSPTRAKECSKPANYKTWFTNATVTPDLIKGKRIRQMLSSSCAVSDESEASGDFELRRLARCEIEERAVRRLEDDLTSLQNTFLVSRAIVDAAIEAARQRYQGTYKGASTDRLQFPYGVLDVEDDLMLQASLAAMADGLLQGAEWTNAKAMATDMGRDTPPLVEARVMAEQMNRVEALAPDGVRTLRDLQNARTALRSCRRAQQQ